ncbi:MAG: hypothetical protein LBN19_02680 [Endomicrobium sp.]|jgi:hypothetical protein|nr:hypothetical protein [Endomicrobium sp.]
MKTLKSLGLLLICLCLLIGSSIIFYSPVPLYDLITGLHTPDFSLNWPKVRLFIEPFYSFSFYILTLNRDFYRPVVISWVLWVAGTVLIYCLADKKKLGQILNNIFYSLMILATAFVFAVLIPIPGPKLEKPQNCIAVDIHSHTISSHDNVAPAEISLKVHLWQGFDAFFNTEHNQTKGFAMFPKDTLYKTVYPGMQVQTENGVSVILLSSEKFDGRDYKNMMLADVIRKAHENKMLVIMPHWWKWHKHTFAELKDFGIDGFEIYNCGYRNFREDDCRALINFSKENNLLMFGVTDWHGWGYMSNVWTVFQGDNPENVEKQLAKKPKTQVILYKQEQSKSNLRFVFEPFAAFYYYIENAGLKYIISFTVWIAVIFVIFRSRFFKYIKKYLPLAMTSIFASGTLYFYVIVKKVADTNEIILNSVIPVLLLFCALWIVLWRINGSGDDSM